MMRLEDADALDETHQFVRGWSDHIRLSMSDSHLSFAYGGVWRVPAKYLTDEELRWHYARANHPQSIDDEWNRRYLLRPCFQPDLLIPTTSRGEQLLSPW